MRKEVKGLGESEGAWQEMKGASLGDMLWQPQARFQLQLCSAELFQYSSLTAG